VLVRVRRGVGVRLGWESVLVGAGVEVLGTGVWLTTVTLNAGALEVAAGVGVDGTFVKVGRSRDLVGTGSKRSRGMLEVGSG
jgi:hypothetical protein